MANQHITILGNGAMATVCATLLEAQPNQVTMWGKFPDQIDLMARTRRNDRYLPNFQIPSSIRLTSDPLEAVQRADLIVSAIPTQFIRDVWKTFAPLVGPDMPIVSVAKGVETDTCLRPTQVILDVAGNGENTRRIAALSGPSIAEELAKCLPATVCVAGQDTDFLEYLQELFTTNWFRVYTNTDLLGVELAGATKNVIALAAGILDGLAAGNNAKSALLSRGLAEISRLAAAMGANPQTFFGVAGVGDLATTCFSPSGRNRSAGEMLGKGLKLNEVLNRIHGIVEGVPTTKAVVQLAERHQVEMPITQAVHDVLFEHLDPIQAIARLMSRQPKAEQIG